MTITCNGNSFIVERSHLGNKIFHPSNMGWKNGVFYWDIPKIHNHTADVHYAFDPKDPSNQWRRSEYLQERIIHHKSLVGFMILTIIK